MNDFTYSVFVLLMALSPPILATSFYDDQARGWFWYEEKKVAPDVEEIEPVLVPAPPIVEPILPVPAQVITPILSPSEQLKAQGVALENAMATAILTPTPENYVNYLALSKAVQAQSQTFATGFSQAITQNPTYDYSLESPNNAQAIIANNEQSNEDNNAVITAMAEETALLFFFRSDCPYCHRFAPIVKKFSGFFGFTVIPISLDNKGLPEYPYPKENLQLVHQLDIKVVPAVALMKPSTNELAIVGFGYSDWTSLIKRMLFAGQQLAGNTEYDTVKY